MRCPSRLRSQGQLVEIGADELAMTGPEARQLLDALDVPRLVDGELATLIARTGGWPAAVYLAGLWLREADNRSVQSFRGSQHTISDYLAREVLSGLDPELERFLRIFCKEQERQSNWLTGLPVWRECSKVMSLPWVHCAHAQCFGTEACTLRFTCSRYQPK